MIKLNDSENQSKKKTQRTIKKERLLFQLLADILTGEKSLLTPSETFLITTVDDLKDLSNLSYPKS